MPEIVHYTATGLLETTIESTATGFYTVQRSPGKYAPMWNEPDSLLLAELRTLSATGVDWSLPELVSHGRRRFRVQGEASVARLALAGLDRKSVSRMLERVSSAVSQLQALQAPDARVASSILRLNAWLRDGFGPGAASQVYEELKSVLGHEALRQLQTRVAEMAEDHERNHVLVLGSAGAGAVYPAQSGASVSLLVDELSLGPAGWDIGWFLGEQLELLDLMQTVVGTSSHQMADPVVAVLVQDSTLPREDLGYFAGLRWLLHMHDFGAYVGWSESLCVGIRNACGVLFDPAGALAQVTVSPLR